MASPVLSPNLAASVKFRNWFKEHLAPLIRTTRDEKNGLLRAQWLRYRRMWTLRGTEQSYHGRQRLYLPLAHRILENWVQKLKADLFPQSGKWFENPAESTTDDERAEILQALFMRHMIDPRGMNLRGKFPALLRNVGMLGTGIGHVGWLHEARTIPTLKLATPGGDGVERTEETLRLQTTYLGPTFRSVDPFLFYVYPATVQSTHEAQLLFEDMLIDWDRLVSMSETPIDPAQEDDLGFQVENLLEVKKLRKAVEGGSTGTRENADHFQAESQRLAERGLRGRADTASRDPNRPMDLTKVSWHGKIPGDPQDDGQATWYQLLVCGDDIPVQIRRHPYWWPHPGWFAAKFSELDNEFWGYGVMFLVDHLQYFTNDVLNQTGDGLTLSLNPIVAMDSNNVQYPDSIRYAPGARWLMRDPANSVHMLEPPKETASTGMQAVGFLTAIANDVSNVSPALGNLQTPGRARGRAVQTATGASIIASEALLQVREVEESIETGILSPMLPLMQSLYQQCLDRDLALRLEGKEGATIIERKIGRDDLIGTYAWQWTGSTFTFNSNVKSQHILNFIQIAARIPPDMLAQDGIKINWKYLLRSSWSTIYGDREANLVIAPLQPTRALDPHLEDDLFRIGRGHEVTVSQEDDDMAHAQEHAMLLQDPDLDPAIKEQVLQHIQRHAASHTMKEMQKQQQAQQQQMAALAGALGGGGPQAGGAGPGGGGAGGASGAQPGSPMTNGRTVMPTAPGRLPQTMTDDDVQRRMPRM